MSMSNAQVILYLLALLSIYALAAALDEQAEQSVLRLTPRVNVAGCTQAASRHGAPRPAAASASAAALPAR